MASYNYVVTYPYNCLNNASNISCHCQNGQVIKKANASLNSEKVEYLWVWNCSPTGKITTDMKQFSMVPDAEKGEIIMNVHTTAMY